MHVFLSYASQDRDLARSVELALREQGYDVFFDRDDLPAGEEFHSRIRRAIEQADLVIFLISPESVDAGSYTITEVDIAEEVRKDPNGRILPVLVRPTPMDAISPYLKAVTLLEPQGNVPASIALAVQRLASEKRRKRVQQSSGVFLVMALVLVAGYMLWPAAPTTVITSRTPTTAADSSRVDDSDRRHVDDIPNAAITGKDGAAAVIVPAGIFTMGDDEEAPQRTIYVDSFYIDQYEVTTARFAKFLQSQGVQEMPLEWDALHLQTGGTLPVIGVDWHEAHAYCEWAGRRLPTEAEWEKAARGTDGRKYPWGNASASPSLANYANTSPEVYDGGLTAVGHYPKGQSPYGVYDMAGNAAEWVADWYTESFALGDTRNPRGPESGPGKVMRGGGRVDPDYRINSVKRFYASPENRDASVGFRCARRVR